MAGTMIRNRKWRRGGRRQLGLGMSKQLARPVCFWVGNPDREQQMLLVGNCSEFVTTVAHDLCGI